MYKKIENSIVFRLTINILFIAFFLILLSLEINFKVNANHLGCNTTCEGGYKKIEDASHAGCITVPCGGSIPTSAPQPTSRPNPTSAPDPTDPPPGCNQSCSNCPWCACDRCTGRCDGDLSCDDNDNPGGGGNPQPTRTPTPTPTPTPPGPPVNLAHFCNPNGMDVTFTWRAPAVTPPASIGSDVKYDLRVEMPSNKWTPECSDANLKGGLCLNDHPFYFYSMPITPNKTYGWWIHAKNAGGLGTAANGASFFCTQPKNWFKLKDASYHSVSMAYSNVIPPSISQYDLTDNSSARYTIFSDSTGAGVLTARFGIDSLETSSANKWQYANYTREMGFVSDFNKYIEYIKAYKTINTVTSTTLQNLKSDEINFIDGDLNINSLGVYNLLLNKDNTVIVVNGTITISNVANNNNKFNVSENKNIAFIAKDKIFIQPFIYEINGIFIANHIDIVSTGLSEKKLKVTGNLISYQPVTLRDPGPSGAYARPSLYVVFSPKMYNNLMPVLGNIILTGQVYE